MFWGSIGCRMWQHTLNTATSCSIVNGLNSGCGKTAATVMLVKLAAEKAITPARTVTWLAATRWLVVGANTQRADVTMCRPLTIVPPHSCWLGKTRSTLRCVMKNAVISLV